MDDVSYLLRYWRRYLDLDYQARNVGGEAMTIRELIEKLQTFDLDAKVVIQDEDELWVLHDIESFGYVPTREGKTLALNVEYVDDPADEPEERTIF